MRITGLLVSTDWHGRVGAYYPSAILGYADPLRTSANCQPGNTPGTRRFGSLVASCQQHQDSSKGWASVRVYALPAFYDVMQEPEIQAPAGYIQDVGRRSVYPRNPHDGYITCLDRAGSKPSTAAILDDTQCSYSLVGLRCRTGGEHIQRF